ncbi:DinB family protein [Neolewinella aurantiaca]|uniref:DinB family protein n=1 Tax=Neolewinella aurantiaca TaxID=2602767 RepID=A0A5C7FN44_9BACT|nr:DinB family protein [Neolewinella aurantiaca]TXF91625.1 DinB family protein [Neolewinella aurantiaca]
MSQISILRSLYIRDLDRLHQEISDYAVESNIWRVLPGTANPGGNLALHLVGNLNTFISAELGNSGYVRNRDAEFNLKDVPRADLLQKIAATKTEVIACIDSLSEEQLSEPYPLRVFSEPMTVGWFLFHLATHLAYHLGQVNYHRRMADAG